MSNQILNDARVHLKRGEVGEARRLLVSIDKAKATDAKVSYYLGVCDYREGKFEKAEQHFRKAAALDGLYANSRYYIGLCLERRGKLKEARIEYLSVLAIDPNHAKANKKIGSNSQSQSTSKTGAKNDNVTAESKSDKKVDAATKLAQDGLAKGIYTDKKSKFVYNTQRIFIFIFSFLFGAAIIGFAVGGIASTSMGEGGKVLGIAAGIVGGVVIGIVNAGSIKKFK